MKLALFVLVLLGCAAGQLSPCDPEVYAGRTAAVVAACEALCAPEPTATCDKLPICLERLDALETECRGR